jgi:CCR4-NOT transcriptional complex subunit CAF120
MPSMTLADGKKLDNILSVSTAASNKYLFHFNSFNSLTQWTAGIRLAVYEHTSLQEAYTGALIAGKGKQLNNIRTLLDRQRAKYEDWVRVRFGAGTPWRRCWCVVNPPDEKEYAKLQKTHKNDAYARSTTILKGDVKFYESKKIGKKTRPIATVTDAYSCYAIYPQSKQLIDQSTLVKVEGKITVHSKPEQTTEGFVFIMPESRPAITGFEIMLQFLFPVFDTFALYGRPNKLVADVLDTRGLMFAMPPDRRYGYLEMWDVVSLIHTEGSDGWTERQWRKQLKDLTSKRMATMPRTRSRASTAATRRNTLQGRTQLPLSRSGTLRFEEPGSVHSQPSTRQPSPTLAEGVEPQAPQRVDSAPPTSTFATPRHQRSASEQVNGYKQSPSSLARLESANEYSNGFVNGTSKPVDEPENSGPPSPNSAESQFEPHDLPEVQMPPTAPPQGPVASPPTFAHAPGQKPPVHVQHPGTKPNANMDSATLHQLADATNMPIPAGIAVASAAAAWKGQDTSNGASNGSIESESYQNNGATHLYAQGAYNSYSGYPGNRLSTIPASPFVEHEQFVGSPATYQPAGPPVPEHVELPQHQNNNEYAQNARLESDGSQVQRKPVPGRSLPLPGDDTRSTRSTTSSTLDSLRNDIVDPEALDRLEYHDPALLRQASQSSSRYSHDDAMSTSTPDYASTTSEEAQPQRSDRRMPDRPRSGMLKFVGNPDLNPNPELVGDAHYKPAAKPLEVTSDIPTIDFGPTYLLDPNAKRPGTSGTMTQGMQDGTFSQSKENLALSSNEQKRQSYSGRTTPTMHMRTTSGSPQILDNRSVAWQPGMVSQPQSHNQKLEAEDWVAQRAAAHSLVMTPPTYPHARSKSRTPPISRTHSGDWSHYITSDNSPARPPSRPLSRPLSRGAGQLLEQRPTSVLVDKRPTSLSAREQEQVARITNTPLIDLSQNPKKEQRPSSAGLTAYIDYREKEKAAAKANRSTSAMQTEIDRRMMAAQQRQMMEMQHMGQQGQIGQAMTMTPGGYMTPNMMATPQGYPQAYAYSTPGQMQQTYQQQGYFPQQSIMTPMPGSMPGGWGTPSPQSMPAQYFMQQPQQQYQQQPATQPYGASFDQAQAAARFAHQQGQQRRQH